MWFAFSGLLFKTLTAKRGKRCFWQMGGGQRMRMYPNIRQALTRCLTRFSWEYCTTFPNAVVQIRFSRISRTTKYSFFLTSTLIIKKNIQKISQWRPAITKIINIFIHFTIYMSFTHTYTANAYTRCLMTKCRLMFRNNQRQIVSTSHHHLFHPTDSRTVITPSVASTKWNAKKKSFYSQRTTTIRAESALNTDGVCCADGAVQSLMCLLCFLNLCRDCKSRQ